MHRMEIMCPYASDTRRMRMYVLHLKQSPVSASRPAQWQAACFYLDAWLLLVIN